MTGLGSNASLRQDVYVNACVRTRERKKKRVEMEHDCETEESANLLPSAARGWLNGLNEHECMYVRGGFIYWDGQELLVWPL